MRGDIRRLPPSVLRFITERLDLEDLERLYATFNFGVQKLLSFPGVVNIVRLNDWILDGPRRYFLCALRNVTRVEVLESIEWPETEIHLLSTLNPLELRLEHGIITQDVDTIDGTPTDPSADIVEHRYRRNWRTATNFHLRRITPRLTRLELCFSAQKDAAHHMNVYRRFPPTLTSFKLVNSSHKEISNLLRSLPSSIRSLSLVSTHLPLKVVDIAPLFPLLEHLSVEAQILIPWDLEDLDAFFPPTLSSLSMTVSFLLLAWVLISSIRMRSAPISKLEILVSEPRKLEAETFDLANMLPPTVVDLTLGMTSGLRGRAEVGHNWHILSLPPQLTSLNLTIFHTSSLFLDSLYSLRHLQMLHIYSHSPAIILVGPGEVNQIDLRPSFKDPVWLDASRFCSSMTSLSLEASKFLITQSSIIALPSSLVSLSLPLISFKFIRALLKWHPRCHLRIFGTVDLWDSRLGRALRSTKFGVPWTSAVSLNDWFSEIQHKCFSHGIQLPSIHFIPRNPIHGALIEHFTAKFAYDSDFAQLGNRLHALLHGMPNLRVLKLKLPARLENDLYLKSLPSSLTHLELDAPAFDTYLDSSSGKLTHLWTTSKLGSWINHQLPASLTHLDAPNWTFSFKLLRLRFLNYEVLRIHIANIKDWQVLKFIASHFFNAKTRFNMQLKLSYALTGLLLPHKNLSQVTWDVLTRITDDIITEQLSAPAPDDSSLSSTAISTSLKRTLGDGIMEFKCDDADTATELFLPPDARVVRLLPPRTWTLGVESNDSLPYSPPKMRSFKHLVHLELHKVEFNDLFEQLPPTLRFLYVTTRCYWEAFGKPCFPDLETLIIKCKPRNTRFLPRIVLPFTLSALPSTLKHLCLSSKAFEIRPDSFLDDTKLNLPSIQSVLVAGIRPASALTIIERLPKDGIVQALLREACLIEAYTGSGWFSERYPDNESVLAAIKASPYALLNQDKKSVREAFDRFYDRTQQGEDI